MKDFGIIIEARMGSSRLPGKILKKINNKTTALDFLLKRLSNKYGKQSIIIATTKSQKDDVIVNFAKKNRYKIFRGSENNVCDRVIKAAKFFKIKHIIEITSDCVLIDTNLIDDCLKVYKYHKVDYVSNCQFRSYPDGMDVQIMKLSSLVKSYKMMTTDYDKENVTTHIRRDQKNFKKINLFAPKKLNYPNLGLTLDTIEDLNLIKKIICYFNKEGKKNNFNCENIIKFLLSNKSLIKINSHVKRNEIK